MSKITNDGLTLYGTGMTGCFIAVPGNSGRRRVKKDHKAVITGLSSRDSEPISIFIETRTRDFVERSTTQHVALFREDSTGERQEHADQHFGHTPRTAKNLACGKKCNLGKAGFKGSFF